MISNSQSQAEAYPTATGNSRNVLRRAEIQKVRLKPNLRRFATSYDKLLRGRE